MSHKPHPAQPMLPLDSTQRMRAIRLVSLREVEVYSTSAADGIPIVRFGVQGHKHLLLLLDHHIGPKDGYPLSYALLAAELDVSESTIYRLAGDLDRVGLIRREPEAAGVVRFSICWANVFDLAELQGVDLRGTTNPIRTTAKSIRATTKDFRAAANSIRGTTNAPLIPPIKPPPPPSDNDPVVVAVRSAGVDKSVEAVKDGRASGQSDEQLLAVVAFFLDPSNAGAWGPGALVERLRTPSGATLLPDQGWPPRKVCAKPVERKPPPAAGDLEQRYGARLDAMSDADLRSRINSKRLLYDLERSGRNDFRVRRDLLQTMSEAEGILT